MFLFALTGTIDGEVGRDDDEVGEVGTLDVGDAMMVGKEKRDERQVRHE